MSGHGAKRNLIFLLAEKKNTENILHFLSLFQITSLNKHNEINVNECSYIFSIQWDIPLAFTTLHYIIMSGVIYVLVFRARSTPIYWSAWQMGWGVQKRRRRLDDGGMKKKTKITNNVKRSVVWVAIVLFLIHLAALCIWPLALSLFRHAKVVYSSKMYILLLTINGVWNNVYTSCATGQYEKEAARMWADGTTMNV